MILVINSSFPELNQLAAGLAEQGMLSRYVRPYANMGRAGERILASIPGLRSAYAQTFGRRVMPARLISEHIQQAALGWDIVMAAHSRLTHSTMRNRQTRIRLMHRWAKAIANAGARAFRDESMVVASWGCAEPAFLAAKTRGAVCVLNYSLAHHAYTRRYLQEEAELEPNFAATLNGHDLPTWQIAQLDREIELADHVLVGSSFVRDTFIAEGVPAEKLEVIPYGVDTSLFRPGEPKPAWDDSFNIVFVGQLSQRKGLSYLLKAYEQIQDAKTTLTLVGQMQDNGTALKPWRHLFRHVPHVPRAQLADLFRQADVFAFPTLIEGMGLVVIEAMACGLPVLTTSNGHGDIVRDGVDGYLVPPRDVGVLAKRMQELKQAPALRKTMALNATTRAGEFTWVNYRVAVARRLSCWMSASR
ncbi:glycosyltransferase family 4 protein [Metallibacterium scheffleri]|uniref:Glycosyl transferase family 1 domain-containing protein n=1 Tax=Metallibacterium scheffleri TaxID=993689 RepID=A0A4S3KL28_9GAMM|nr:glycosyltransferase family 4 protein [Metallibacterium scheffleri]THD09543.1 hypothetical protein B1806_10770 [Metallibacterium scheffleri]